MTISTLLALAIVSSAPAEQLSAPPLVPAPTTDVPMVKRDRFRFGMLIDAGVPDGLGASLAYHPLSWLRLQLGAMNNTASTGIRGGVALVAFESPIRLTLTAEGGHYFEGDASWVLGDGGEAQVRSILSRVSYNFANGHVGLELGSRRFAFFLRGGISYVDVSLPGLQDAFASMSSIPALPQSPKIHLVIPSAKLGFILFLL